MTRRAVGTDSPFNPPARPRAGAAGLLLACAALVAAPLRAEGPDVRARLLLPSAVAPGASAAVAVELTLGPGWHVNSHSPSESYLVPTSATLSAPTGSFSPVRYPKGVARRFSFSDKPLDVYEGTVRFEAELSVPAGATGAIAVRGVVSYQACNDQQCYPPARITLDGDVKVSAPTSR